MPGPKAKSTAAPEPVTAAVAGNIPPEPSGRGLARNLLEPQARHGLCAQMFIAPILGGDCEQPAVSDYIAQLRSVTERAEVGDTAIASRILASQALTLDSMFTDMARRAVMNFNTYPDAGERYMRLALKAQGNSRATLETLAKLHQPREQTVRHVHVYEGGQAVVAEQFHHHTGMPENANRAEQSHEQGALGSQMPGAQSGGKTLPVPSDEGAQALPSSWGNEPRCPDRKPTRAKARRKVG